MDTKALRLGIACVALLGLAACGNNSRPMIMVTDSGGTDSGTPVGTDSGPRIDSGAPDTCPPDSADPPTTGMVCAASTATCLMSATTQAAYDACLAADPNAMACGTCLNTEAIANCSATGVCDNEWGEIGCCVVANCSDQACANAALQPGGACETEVNAFLSCAQSASCGNTSFCFMAATGFFPSATPSRFPFLPDLMSSILAAQTR